MLSTISKFFGGTIKAADNYSKIKFASKSNKKFFQIFLMSEEDELSQLNKVHSHLINTLKLELVSGENNLFDNKYKISDILIKDGIWKGRILNLDKMEKAIVSLSNNIGDLKAELEEEEKHLRGLKTWF